MFSYRRSGKCPERTLGDSGLGWWNQDVGPNHSLFLVSYILRLRSKYILRARGISVLTQPHPQPEHATPHPPNHPLFSHPLALVPVASVTPATSPQSALSSAGIDSTDSSRFGTAWAGTPGWRCARRVRAIAARRARLGLGLLGYRWGLGIGNGIRRFWGQR